MKDTRWQPATAGERYRTIDIIRGLALFGVVMINLLTGFRLPLLEHIRNPHSDPGRANALVDLLAAGVLEFKAFTIFSFLFGAGVAIQFERAASRQVRARMFLLRRFGWLLVFGLIHLFLIWNGDILTLYAVCGLLLLPCLGLSWAALFAIGALFVLGSDHVSFGLNLPSGQAASANIARARQVYSGGSLLEIQRLRWHEAWSLIVPLLAMVSLRTVGVMYWGMAAWRSGVLREPQRHRGKLVAAMLVGVSLGGMLTVRQVSGRNLWPALRAIPVDASILLALAYVSGLLLALTGWRREILPGLAATGQMALSNYLLQSIVLGFVFYAYGLGLFGRLDSVSAACVGVALYVIQVQLSRMWLRHFRFGPFEWLWRSLAYGRRQPWSQPAHAEVHGTA